jgi:hypothetical protein
MKKLLLLLTAVTASAQLAVTRTNFFTWTDPNVPKANYTVYAAGPANLTMSSTTNKIALSLLLSSAPAGIYTLNVRCWLDGEPSDLSTNLVISWPKQKPKNPHTLRIQ